MNININVSNLSKEVLDYVERSARIRGISKTRLMYRIIKVICEEQMILSVLDDESKQERKLPGEKARTFYRRIKEDAHSF